MKHLTNTGKGDFSATRGPTNYCTFPKAQILALIIPCPGKFLSLRQVEPCSSSEPIPCRLYEHMTARKYSLLVNFHYLKLPLGTILRMLYKGALQRLERAQFFCGYLNGVRFKGHLLFGDVGQTASGMLCIPPQIQRQGII